MSPPQGVFMTSDLMPSPESSNSFASDQPQTNIEAAANIHIAAPQSSKPENSSLNTSENATDENLADRQQPIPPPSEPMQYRAIGLVRGRYRASDEQFTQGILLTTDGVELNAVLLGRIMSLVKNHLDLEQDHLWVVYPRTRQENDTLHIQIVGVWEPENLAKNSTEEDEQDALSQETIPEEPEAATKSPAPSSNIPDGGFSVRGEVVYQSFDAKSLVVKIKQAPRKPTDKPKYFKLKLRGVLTTKAVGKFWDFQAKREGDVLVVQTAEAIADLPKKRRPPFKGGGGGGPRGGFRKPFPPRRPGETPRPIKKVGGETSAVSKPQPKAPVPKPVKKPKPTE
ncbi:alr1700 [Nostoc sp. PCC 7120 = FACHB-418]|nr:alr1700 [Nostoc sp. PCC 7120 = FACHB-418]